MDSDDYDDSEEIIYDNNSFSTSLFALNNLDKNLIFLSLDSCGFDDNILENLNHLDSLEELKLNEFHFGRKFILNLKNLKKIFLFECHNFTFSQNMCLNLKSINIEACMIEKNNGVLKFQKLEKLRLLKDSIGDIIDLNSKIDFNSLINLKILYIDIANFMHINDSILLENLRIYCLMELIDANYATFCKMKINSLKKYFF